MVKLKAPFSLSIAAQKMPNLDFNSLLTDNRRSSDDFVNATEWCKQFGKDFAYFWKSPEIRAFARVLDKKLKKEKSAELAPSSKSLSYDRPVRGKKGDTFIHPLLAIKLAECLSPEFDVFVKGTLRPFIENPDDFVNATEWCKQFGKRWAKFDQLLETKAFVRAYCDKHKVSKKDLVYTLDGSGTFIHPDIAERLLRWLEKSESKKPLTEKVVQKRLAAKRVSQMEVQCKSGVIDILFSDEIVEVKDGKAWKSAIGQVLVYNLEYPTRIPRIHLFNCGSDEWKMMVTSFCSQLNVRVTFED